MINPTIALTAASGRQERLAFAKRCHIHTVLTCHQPGNTNMSQNTSINESIIVMRRHNGPKPLTRFINLDRLPVNDGEVADFHHCLADCEEGMIANGWGEVSYWASKRVEGDDWTPAIWRSPELADAAFRYANHSDLRRISDMTDVAVTETGRVLRRSFERAEPGDPGGFPILKSKGADAQRSIKRNQTSAGLPSETAIGQLIEYMIGQDTC